MIPNNLLEFSSSSFNSPVRVIHSKRNIPPRQNPNLSSLFDAAIADNSLTMSSPPSTKSHNSTPGSGEKRLRQSEYPHIAYTHSGTTPTSTPGSAEKKQRPNPNQETPATRVARALDALGLQSPGTSLTLFEDTSSNKEKLNSSEEISSRVTQLLNQLDNYNTLTETEGKKLLTDLDLIFFQNRNLKAGDAHRDLYSAETVLNIYGIYSRIYGTEYTTETRTAHKTLILTVQLALKGMSVDQKEELLNYLSMDTIANDIRYKGLSEICFAKYFLQIDPPRKLQLTSLPSYETTLKQVIQKTKRDIILSTSQENLELCQKVQDLALSLLNSSGARKFPLQQAFHVTSASSLPYILEKGIPVSHGKTYPGAFTSSDFEESFGSVGVAVSTNRLAAMQNNLTRIERRFKQDGGHIWIGSNTPLPIIPDLITYSSQLPENELLKLKEIINPFSSDCLFVPSNVLKKFLDYSREDHWITPVPAMTNKKKLLPKERPSETCDTSDSTLDMDIPSPESVTTLHK